VSCRVVVVRLASGNAIWAHDLQNDISLPILDYGGREYHSLPTAALSSQVWLWGYCPHWAAVSSTAPPPPPGGPSRLCHWSSVNVTYQGTAVIAAVAPLMRCTAGEEQQLLGSPSVSWCSQQREQQHDLYRSYPVLPLSPPALRHKWEPHKGCPPSHVEMEAWQDGRHPECVDTA
jgi:hypothetical protein